MGKKWTKMFFKKVKQWGNNGAVLFLTKVSLYRGIIFRNRHLSQRLVRNILSTESHPCL